MKSCPQCSFVNHDTPCCAWCNSILVNAETVPDIRRDLAGKYLQSHFEVSRTLEKRHLRGTGLTYMACIVLTAMVPGLVFNAWALLLFFGSTLIVYFAVSTCSIKLFALVVLQGAMSAAILFYFDIFHPFSAFMILAHIICPIILSHAVELITSMHR